MCTAHLMTIYHMRGLPNPHWMQTPLSPRCRSPLDASLWMQMSPGCRYPPGCRPPFRCRPPWMQSPTLNADPQPWMQTVPGCRPPGHVTFDSCWEANPRLLCEQNDRQHYLAPNFVCGRLLTVWTNP